jgi:DNA-binding NarL/FixJ family response regulator
LKPTRVLLADDHSLIRIGVRTLVEQLGGMEVVGEASDGRMALEMIKKHYPDLVLMDIGMAGINGLEATARVTKDFPGG